MTRLAPVFSSRVVSSKFCTAKCKSSGQPLNRFTTYKGRRSRSRIGSSKPCLIMKSSRASVPLMLLFLPGDAPMSEGCTPIPYARIFDTSSKSAKSSPPCPDSFFMGVIVIEACCAFPSLKLSEMKDKPEFLLFDRNLSNDSRTLFCASRFCSSVVAPTFA